MVAIGAYVGNNASGVTGFNSWLGEPMDMVGVHTGRANWSDWSTSIGWQIGNFKAAGPEIRWTIPMFADGGSLAQGASGAYNAHYVDAARQLAAAFGSQDRIIVRVGEEFNGNWMPWAAPGKEADYIKTYQNFVDAFRSVSDKFVFEWNVNIGEENRMNPAAAYPGDNYVDIISMDFYYDSRWDNPDPVKAWNYNVSRPYGLQWLEDFADAHGKPSAYSEWGVDSPNAGPYIQLAAQWFQAHDDLFALYWDSNDAFAGKLSGDVKGAASDAFQLAFGPVAAAPAAVDTVYSTVDATLNATMANLTLQGFLGLKGTGNALANTITGTAGNDTLSGLAGNDKLIGNDGNDTLDGGTGADNMTGGAGNDSYVVDDAGDTVIEAVNGGIDSVTATISHVLADNVENLTLVGAGAFAGTGNALDNVISGGSGNDTLLGLPGNDTLRGNAGNDILDGGLGADGMNGGAGNDTFYVDNAGDWIYEAAGGGSDTIYSSISYKMGDNIEAMVLTGTVGLTGTGNAIDNLITGGSGNDILYGLGGADTLRGGAGNDILDGGAGGDGMNGGAGDDVFYVDNVSDWVYEAAGGGTDTIYASVSFKAPVDVEALVLTGTAAINADGNTGDNSLTGNGAANILKGDAGNDRLSGGAGADTLIGGTGDDSLTGGAGADKFQFARGSGKDVITDLGVGGVRDTVDLSDFLKAGYKATVVDSGADTLISFTTGDSIRLLGVHANELTWSTTGFTH